jgi:hypothetical protein
LEGSRRAFSADFIRTLADDFRLHGRQAIEKVRKQQPAAYMKICALLVPREMKVEHTNAVESLSDEQLEQAIEAVKAMLEARAGEEAKVIEGTAEPAALPAPEAQSPEDALEAKPKRKPNRLMMEADTAARGSASRAGDEAWPWPRLRLRAGEDEVRSARSARGIIASGNRCP